METRKPFRNWINDIDGTLRSINNRESGNLKPSQQAELQDEKKYLEQYRNQILHDSQLVEEAEKRAGEEYDKIKENVEKIKTLGERDLIEENAKDSRDFTREDAYQRQLDERSSSSLQPSSEKGSSAEAPGTIRKAWRWFLRK